MSSLRKVSVFQPGVADVERWSPVELSDAPLDTCAMPDAPPADPVADAFALGFSGGRIEGEQAERARLRATMRAAEEALDAINVNGARWVGSANEDMTALAVAIARHLIEREVAHDHALVVKLVSRALADYPIDEPVRLRVHPDDLAVLDSVKDSELQGATMDRATWIADPRVSRGGCVIEGRERIVDARIESALERVYRRLARPHD